jgi:hypothetical protein
MTYKFNAYGHPNILATHKTTLEFTKDNELSLKGDCIVGVKADFELKEIKQFIKNSKNKKISITIKTISKNKKYKKIQETIIAEINPNFDDDREFVIRKVAGKVIDVLRARTFPDHEAAYIHDEDGRKVFVRVELTYEKENAAPEKSP